MAKNNDKLEKGKASLKEMMETLRPFLPKPDKVIPTKKKGWSLTDEESPVKATSKKEPAEF